MSGSSFNYLCDAEDASASRYDEMAEACEEKWPSVAAELRRIAALKIAAEQQHQEFYMVMKAVEWYFSGDWGPERVDEAFAEWEKGREMVAAQKLVTP